jgi:hypothetical protein
VPTFRATFQDPSNPIFEVPAEIIGQLGGGKRPAVTASFNGIQFRTTIAVYGGLSYLGVRRELRDAAQLEPGDVVEITLERDDQPRTVEVPDDLAQALARDPEASQVFESLSFTNRKEYVSWITSARRAETRQRRLVEVPALLRQGRRTPQ